MPACRRAAIITRFQTFASECPERLLAWPARPPLPLVDSRHRLVCVLNGTGHYAWEMATRGRCMAPRVVRRPEAAAMYCTERRRGGICRTDRRSRRSGYATDCPLPDVDLHSLKCP